MQLIRMQCNDTVNNTNNTDNIENVDGNKSDITYITEDVANADNSNIVHDPAFDAENIRTHPFKSRCNN